SRACSARPATVSTRRSRTGTILAASVLIAAGFAVAVVEMLRLPKGTIWIVVAVAVAALAGIRSATRGTLASTSKGRTHSPDPAPCVPDRLAPDRALPHPSDESGRASPLRGSAHRGRPGRTRGPCAAFQFASGRLAPCSVIDICSQR